MSALETRDADSLSPTSSLLRTLLLCDMVDSTALVERLGDREAAELIRKHDRLARTLADRHGGHEIDKTDGFLMMFDRPVQAVAFALDYQRGLRQLNAAENTTLSVRVGIHVGDVVVWDNSSEDIAKGAKPIEVEGLVKPITSRLMSLALPGQILLSNIAYDLAHRAQGELGEALEKVRWRTHGRYRFRGVPDPVAVFEVGEEGLAPLKAPPWSSKAHREVPFWRRPATVVIEGLVVLALVAIPLLMFLRPDPAIAFASRDWVVVGSLHNLTGETLFDDALESALRIGLEQSRYVNVLPDLKVRDTITRMQRDPDSTEVDRAVGSEVAIRDGAKALILPTIAEIGGRVRITAEVIDPHTQTTVYSETADGIGKESILPSLDTINSRLRVRLGEALATVSNESMPLEKVATENLDALKAFSLGIRNNALGKFPQAMALYQQALGLDPGFASAHLRIGAVHASAARGGEAMAAFETALAHRDRLTARDALYAEVMLASIRMDADVLSRWAALADTYPDYFVGAGGYAYVGWRDANRFDPVMFRMAESSAAPQNPTRTPALHLLGILNLGADNFEKALQNFAEAESAGFVRTEYHAATLAAQRKFSDALAVLARSPDVSPAENPAVSELRTVLESAFLVDQGKFDVAADVLSRARERVVPASALDRQHELAAIGMRLALSADAARLADLEAALATAEGERKRLPEKARGALDMRLHALAFIAANAGHASLAKAALATTEGSVHPRYSATAKLRRIAEAVIQRRQGEPADAIAKLEAMLDGSELFLTHVALLDAYAANSESSKALAEVRWLSRHRGRAYAESSPGNMLGIANVEHSTLALLRGAELAAVGKEAKLANTLLESFLQNWPDAASHPALAPRIAALQAERLPVESP